MDLGLLVESTETNTFVYPLSAELLAIRERTREKKKQYVFVLNVQWSDSSSSVIWRSYSEFFELHCLLLNAFPVEAGNGGKPRIIPHLTGRQIFKKSDIKLAEKRKPLISKYVKELLLLPKNISQGSLLVSFFHKRRGDPECFNQFPTKLNSKSEFDEILHELNNESEEDGKQLIEENILNGHVNVSFDKSMSFGRKR